MTRNGKPIPWHLPVVATFPLHSSGPQRNSSRWRRRRRKQKRARPEHPETTVATAPTAVTIAPTTDGPQILETMRPAGHRMEAIRATAAVPVETPVTAVTPVTAARAEPGTPVARGQGRITAGAPAALVARERPVVRVAPAEREAMGTPPRVVTKAPRLTAPAPSGRGFAHPPDGQLAQWGE